MPPVEIAYIVSTVFTINTLSTIQENRKIYKPVKELKIRVSLLSQQTNKTFTEP